MNKNILIVVGITILFLGTCINPSVAIDNVKKSSMLVSNGNILYVGGSGPDNYTKIQDAIDNSSDDDTVFVYDDSSPYYEHVIIDKSINLIGEDRNTTIIDGGGIEDVIYIPANKVTITGFTMQNAGENDIFPNGVDAGIEIRSNYNNIYGNIITNNIRGIFLYQSGRNTISTNIITNNKEIGIHSTEWVRHNYIFGNIIENTTGEYYGFGLVLLDSFNTVLCNTIQNNKEGIRIFGMNIFNIISKNHIINNKDYGIYFIHSISYDIIKKNNFMENGRNAFFKNFILYPPINSWDSNYWDDWDGAGPKCIRGVLYRNPNPFEYYEYPWYQFDWRPAQEPYDI